MKNSPNRLDVFLRGSRNYVQGTQLISESAKQLPEGNFVLKKASFTNITKKDVGVVSYESERSVASDAIGHVSFRNTTGSDLVFGLFEQTEDARRDDVPFTFKLALQVEDDTSSQYSFSGVENMGDLLDCVVQAIKTFIERQSPQHYDIWFTGIRNIHIPVTPNGIGETGSIKIAMLKVQRNHNVHQSLFDVEIELENNDRLSGYVTFAHKLD